MIIPIMNTILMIFFFFNDTATTEIYTLSLHDALPIYFGILLQPLLQDFLRAETVAPVNDRDFGGEVDRKSTRLNSSHSQISYAVFCLKKKTKSSSSSFYCTLSTYYTFTTLLYQFNMSI